VAGADEVLLTTAPLAAMLGAVRGLADRAAVGPEARAPAS
jgi:hypothetical protein